MVGYSLRDRVALGIATGDGVALHEAPGVYTASETLPSCEAFPKMP